MYVKTYALGEGELLIHGIVSFRVGVEFNNDPEDDSRDPCFDVTTTCGKNIGVGEILVKRPFCGPDAQGWCPECVRKHGLA